MLDSGLVVWHPSTLTSIKQGGQVGEGKPKMRSLSVHPNSLAASRDEELQKVIRKGRRQMRREAGLMESWARNDFRPVIQL